MARRPLLRKVYTRLYRDNGQLSAYAEWQDGARTCGQAVAPLEPAGLHMTALFDRARREGITIKHEVW